MTYTIKKGDTLSAIAKANNTTVSELARLNGISNPNLIYAGATLEIPENNQSKAGAASGGSTSQSYSAPNANTSTDPAAPTYKESAAVAAARDSLERWEGAKPDDYVSPYKSSIDSKIAEILGREDFSYDPALDPVYRYYRDRYLTDGERAMRDAMGQASALTGGYGNSYAAAVGQSAYNDHVTRLGELIPTLAAAAFDRYGEKWKGEREDLEALLGLDDTEYSRYRDGVDDYYRDGDYLYKKYSDYADDDYEKFLDILGQWNDDRDYNRKVYEDERDYAYKVERDAAKDGGASSSGSGSKGSGGGSETKGASIDPDAYYPSSKLAESGVSAMETALASIGDKLGTVQSDFGYFDCGSRARRIIDELNSSEIYDSGGHLKASVIDRLKKEKKDGKITSDEYKFILKKYERR